MAPLLLSPSIRNHSLSCDLGRQPKQDECNDRMNGTHTGNVHIGILQRNDQYEQGKTLPTDRFGELAAKRQNEHHNGDELEPMDKGSMVPQ